MQKILLGAIIAATVLLVYPSLMMPEQSVAQTTDQNTSTDSTGSVLPCNTSSQTRTGSFFTIDGINGQNGKSCLFEIKDFSFGVENPTTIGSATGGAGAGKATFHEFQITKKSDSASPIFFQHVATGQHFNTATLTMRKAGGDPQSGTAFLVYKFGTVFTTKIDWSGPGDEGPEEQITFVYGKLAVQYQPQKPNGTLGVPISSCFDAVRNTLC